MRERRGYIVLVAISLFFSILVFAAGRSEQINNEHKFCDIVRFSLSVPAPKPADPKAHPSRQRAYEGYQKVVKLGHSLGC